ncbi:hypothetical protein GDO86_009747 [Hymenochirus boettgeri]|uniref:Uncharacterized protein n=1 Tax=Hymenochirus boettgeri TaxID=247094 RepID=A0A8T2JMG9_9PIPI|nr:hypothetical protein GDO86_009747 [Hymenochirus boettgeri]
MLAYPPQYNTHPRTVPLHENHSPVPCWHTSHNTISTPGQCHNMKIIALSHGGIPLIIQYPPQDSAIT